MNTAHKTQSVFHLKVDSHLAGYDNNNKYNHHDGFQQIRAQKHTNGAYSSINMLPRL